MSTTEVTTPKKAHVLTEEHKAKMAAGRVAAAAKRAAEKTTVAEPVTPTKVKEVVCPPTPKKATPDTPEAKLLALAKEARVVKRALDKEADNKKAAERRAVKTKTRMIEAAAPLAYYKKVLAAIEKIEGVKRDEVLAYFNEKIEDLEADVAGKARYAYVIDVKESGDMIYTTSKVLKTSQQVSAYVAQKVDDWRDPDGDDNDLDEPFPTAESIDARLGDAENIREIELFNYGQPDVWCLSFILSRYRKN